MLMCQSTLFGNNSIGQCSSSLIVILHHKLLDIWTKNVAKVLAALEGKFSWKNVNAKDLVTWLFNVFMNHILNGIVVVERIVYRCSMGEAFEGTFDISNNISQRDQSAFVD